MKSRRWHEGSSRLHKRCKGERRQDLLPRRELLRCLSAKAQPILCRLGRGPQPTCLPHAPFPAGTDPSQRTLSGESPLGEKNQHSCRRNTCHLLTLIVVWKDNQQISDTWENQQHEREVPRLTRQTAHVGGKRDNSGNRRGVKKTTTGRKVHSLKQ